MCKKSILTLMDIMMNAHHMWVLAHVGQVLHLLDTVRVSPVALWFGSEMDPYRRDLTNILHSYLVSDSLGPILGARAWSCKTTKRLPRLSMAPEYFGNLRREMSQVATQTFNVLYYFPFIWFIRSHCPRSYI